MKPFIHTLFTRFLSAGLVLLLFNGSAFAGSVKLAWDASTSTNVGGYTVSYGTSSGNYTSSIDAGKATTYTLTGLLDGTKYYFAVKAYDLAKTNVSGYSNEINMTVPVATTPVPTPVPTPVRTPTPTPVRTPTPTPVQIPIPTTVPTPIRTPIPTPVRTPTPTPTSLTVNFTANKTNGAPGLVVNFTPVTSGTLTSWKWSFTGSSTPSVTNTTAKVVTVTYPNPGIFSVSLTASGPSGSAAKIQTNLITVTALTPTPSPVPVPPPGSVTIVKGLVAAYAFNEINGVTALDSSGNGNHGTIKEAVRIDTPSKYGKALQFDGINDWVTINDSASLDFTNGMTLEAWVHPQDLAGFGKTVIMKEQIGGAVYNLYANEDTDLPVASFNDGRYRVISGIKQLPVNQPTHLATTYDGQYQRLYVNGVEVAKQIQKGLIQQSSNKLRIGGNSIWGEFFEGYIDEVRIYNRALTPTEINKDLATPIVK